ARYSARSSEFIAPPLKRTLPLRYRLVTRRWGAMKAYAAAAASGAEAAQRVGCMRRLTGLLVLALVGCPEHADGNHIPEVRSFKCTPDSGMSPVDTTCAWEINDADGEPVRCIIDQGPDGNPDQTVENCTVTGGVRLRLTEPGTHTIRLFLV